MYVGLCPQLFNSEACLEINAEIISALRILVYL